jgi:hypothetical protein
MALQLKQEKRLLDADQLRAIGAALPGKLRAHQLSEAFIDRYAEELVQQALAEYARACNQGQVIDNPGGWIVNTAFRRAIDQLRRGEGGDDSPGFGGGGPGGAETPRGPAPKYEPSMRERRYRPRSHWTASPARPRCPTGRRGAMPETTTIIDRDPARRALRSQALRDPCSAPSRTSVARA